MQIQNYTEQDWKLFRSRLPQWQEAYMNRLNMEYTALLTGEGSPSDKFWALEKRIKEDMKSPGVITEMRRSKLQEHLIGLLHDGAITQSDLEGFSDRLKQVVIYLALGRE